jgi:Adenylate and Guanylate cyclase catalytic domain
MKAKSISFCLTNQCGQVDTVGGSFMAVCGVPQRRLDHVHVASCFARDFFKNVHEGLPELIHTLNLEEIGLSLKAGIHCGEVE